MSEKIEFIELRFTDLLGRLKAMTVPCRPANDLKQLANDSALKKGTSCDGSSIVGLSSVEVSDLRLEPDISSLIEIPSTDSSRIAAAMCFIKQKDAPMTGGEYFPNDTRGRLHAIYAKYLPGNLELRVKVEPEFHLITPEGEPFDDAGYADIYPRSPAMDVLLEIASAAINVGITPRVIHHEVGEAQQEIELNFDDSRRMADNILIFKNIARTAAQAHGIDVTFMPKPFVDKAGNGLHCHLQLWDGDKNLFGDYETSGLSETAHHFIAGLLEHAPAITAIANPSVNSFKRLVPHHEAPVYITWGERNRTALVRVPLFGSAEKAAIELRSGDAMMNPYLLFSVIIAAGMDGINRKLTPPKPRSEDIFHMTQEERQQNEIKMLPKTLSEALDCLEGDPVILNALGTQIADHFIKLKRDEWCQYISQAVTEWEWMMYSEI